MPTLFSVCKRLASFVRVCAFAFLLSLLLLSPKSAFAAIDPGALVTLHNQTRAAARLDPLTWDDKLAGAAEAKAADMLAQGYFAHTSPSGKTPWSWIDDSGYYYQYAGENLGIDFSDTTSLYDAWLASPTHYANIIKPSYQNLGIGVTTGDFEGRETTVVAVTFAGQFATAAQISQVAGETNSVTSSGDFLTASTPTVAPVNPPTIHAPAVGEYRFTKNPIEIRGEAITNAMVEIQDNDQKILRTPTNEAGEFAVQIDLVDGRHAISLVTIASDGRRSTAARFDEVWQVDRSLADILSRMEMKVSATVLRGHSFGVLVTLAEDAQNVVPSVWVGEQKYSLSPKADGPTYWHASIMVPDSATSLSLYVELTRDNITLATSETAEIGVLERYELGNPTADSVRSENPSLRFTNFSLFSALLFLTLIAVSLSLKRILRHFQHFHRRPVWGWLNYVCLATVVSPFLFVSEAFANRLI